MKDLSFRSADVFLDATKFDSSGIQPWASGQFRVCTAARLPGPTVADASLRQAGRGSANFASVSSALENVTKLLPRFPPNRQDAVADGGARGSGDGQRQSAKHVLQTRDVHEHEAEAVIALEVTHGRKRAYKSRDGCRRSDGLFDMIQARETGGDAFRKFWTNYLLPQGYPDSVSPQYSEYMTWRGIQYFFGGAISVFTTKALLGAVGVTKGVGVSAAAVNWVVKDGAGRLGRFLFARWGHQLDCELKQFRLLGDALMEGGAILELTTAALPRQFLVIACTANLAKNLAAVAASSTRAPIYREFALRNNMGDVTAKGESVANIADIVGSAVGIALSRLAVPMWANFAVLSLGYLYASRREVDAVILPYMNQARLAYATHTFFTQGRVPTVFEGNKNEPLVPLGSRWAGYGQVKLGASIEAACVSPDHLRRTLAAFPPGSPYYLTYRPDRDQVFVMLRQGADHAAALEACFTSHVLLDMINRRRARKLPVKGLPALPVAAAPGARVRGGGGGAVEAPGGAHAARDEAVCRGGGDDDALEWEDLLPRALATSKGVWDRFLGMAVAQGWQIQSTMLAIGDTRLVTQTA